MATVHGAVDFEDAGRFVAVVADFAVSVIVAEDDVVVFGEVNRFLEELLVHCGRGWVVGVIQEHHLDVVSVSQRQSQA